MHVVFRESHGLEETAAPFDPAQDPADMLVLSYSDSDLGAFGAGWQRAKGALPTLRLCNLIALRHPVSVDTYIERTAHGAKAILVRLIGGEAYWPYGLASLSDLARKTGIALAILPDCPCATQSIAVIGYLIAFEAGQRCHNQLAFSAGFQPLQFRAERGFLLRIKQVGLINHTAGQFWKILRNCCLTGEGQQQRNKQAKGLIHVQFPDRIRSLAPYLASVRILHRALLPDKGSWAWHRG